MNENLVYEVVRARGYLRDEDVDFIIELAASLPPEFVRIADLGAGGGTTALAALTGRAGRTTQMITVDRDGAGVREAEIQVGVLGTEGAEWSGVVGDSAEAASQFLDVVFDMIMLDTSHEYDQTVAEFAAWLPLLSSGGIFWCHDYLPAEGHPGYGCTQAIDEAIEREGLQILGIRGLGIGLRKL